MKSKLSKRRLDAHTRPLHILALATLGTTLLGTAQAQNSYWTFGIGAGQTRGAFDEQTLTSRNSSNLSPGALTTLSIATDRRDAGGKVFLGRQFNPYVAVELGYFNLGKFGWQTQTAPPGTLVGEIRAQGANADLVGTLPLTTNLSALARAGATYTRTRAEYSSTGAVRVINASPSQRKTNPKLGLGLQYAFNEHFQMRAEAEEYRVANGLDGRGKVRMYSVSFVVPFGRSMQAAPRSANVAPPVAALPKVEPAMTLSAPLPPVVVAQTKPPVPTPVPATVPPRRVNYSAASMFGFDASAMQAEGRAALDTLSKELVGAQYESIKVEGHTDRLGSTEYNQALSQRRADSVKDYLVNTAGVPPSKVSTAAMGEAKPVTKAEECKGTTQSAQLITCLQPDRRVEIEVSGTR